MAKTASSTSDGFHACTSGLAREPSFVKFTDAELERFRAIGGKPVWDDWVAKAEAKGIPGKDLLNLILTTSKK